MMRPRVLCLCGLLGAGCSLTVYPPAPGDEVDATAHLSIDGRELPLVVEPGSGKRCDGHPALPSSRARFASDAAGRDVSFEKAEEVEAPVPAPPADDAQAEWSPAQVQPDGHAMEEIYGTPSVPEGDGTECLRFDPTLWSHADHIKERYGRYRSLRHAIDENEGGLDAFSQGYKKFGFNRGEHEGKQGIWYREWAPGAKALALVGDFND